MLKLKYKIISAAIIAAPLLLNTGIATTVHASPVNNRPGVVCKSPVRPGHAKPAPVRPGHAKPGHASQGHANQGHSTQGSDRR